MSDAPTRREVLVRTAGAGLVAAGVAGAALHFHGRPGWPRSVQRTVLPSWHVASPKAPDLVIARGSPPGALVEAALDALGSIRAYVAPGDRVLVKPNAAFDRPAWQGTTTSPEVVGAVVRACIEAQAGEVVVTDNPIHAPEGCFRKSGIGRATEDAGGRVLLPRPEAFTPVSLPGRLLDGWPVFTAPLLAADKVIGIAPVKDHNLARASMTMKNWYGLLGGPRNRLHQKLDEAIATLAELIRPTLAILDGTRILVRNGPTGGSADDVIRGDVVAVSADPVALDAFGATLLGLEASDLGYLALAEQRGVGTTDLESLDVREITL